MQKVYRALRKSLKALTFLKCSRRFIARQGAPQLVIPDNAKAFQSAAKELEVLFEHPDIQAVLTENRIT